MSPNSASHNLFVFDTPEDLAKAAAERFVTYCAEAIQDHEKCSVALAGGSTPRRVYELLATDPYRTQIDWSRIHLFFGDERCVPPDHPGSNYRMVYQSLLSKLPVHQENVHRIRGEIDPDQSAQVYEDSLKAFFSGLPWPRFDLALLGVGADGHTASLFPNSAALKEASRWVIKTKQNESGQNRITLTLPVFNHAAHVMFLVTGKEKAARLRDVLQGASTDRQTPAAMIRPVGGTLEWFADAQAAALL